MEAVKGMVYAEACAKEMLRMVPIVGAVLRRALKDFEVDGLRIQKVSQRRDCCAESQLGLVGITLPGHANVG